MTTDVDEPVARVPLRRAADEAHSMVAVTQELQLMLPSVPIDQIAALVERLWLQFDDAPVRDFVPLLVGKQARRELLDHQ